MPRALTRHRRDHCRRHRNTCTRSIFWNSTFRNVDVQVFFTEIIWIYSERFGPSPDACQSSPSRLLHYLAKFAGQCDLTFTLYKSCLNLEDVTAHFGPCQPV